MNENTGNATLWHWPPTYARNIIVSIKKRKSNKKQFLCIQTLQQNQRQNSQCVMCSEQKVEDMKGITVLHRIRVFGENIPVTSDYYKWGWGKPKPKILDQLTAKWNVAQTRTGLKIPAYPPIQWCVQSKHTNKVTLLVVDVLEPSIQHPVISQSQIFRKQSQKFRGPHIH